MLNAKSINEGASVATLTIETRQKQILKVQKSFFNAVSDSFSSSPLAGLLCTSNHSNSTYVSRQKSNIIYLLKRFFIVPLLLRCFRLILTLLQRLFLNGPTPASLCLFSFIAKTNYYSKKL